VVLGPNASSIAPAWAEGNVVSVPQAIDNGYLTNAFPKSYAQNTNEPAHFAFVKDADGQFNFSRPDPEFWRHFEQRILDLQA
jgi:hypothetical protein